MKYTIRARFNDEDEWQNWSGVWSEKSLRDMEQWYYDHWGPETENVKRLFSGDDVSSVQFSIWCLHPRNNPNTIQRTFPRMYSYQIH